MNKIIKVFSDIFQDITDSKVKTSREFIKWLKNDFNGNGISDYLE